MAPARRPIALLEVRHGEIEIDALPVRLFLGGGSEGFQRAVGVAPLELGEAHVVQAMEVIGHQTQRLAERRKTHLQIAHVVKAPPHAVDGQGACGHIAGQAGHLSHAFKHVTR